MKTVLKTMMTGVAALCAFAAPAFAYTFSGTIPATTPPKPIVLHLYLPVPGLMKITMKAPPVHAGVDYALSYCIGPAANPCGSTDSWSVQVPRGQTVYITVPSSRFTGKVFVVGQGTSRPVPYFVEVDVLP